MHGITTSIPYANKLLSECDILVLCEHWLPENELFKLNEINSDFMAMGKSGQPVSQSTYVTHSWGGTAVLWRESIDFYVNAIQVDSRRICGISIQQGNDKKLYIIGVYLPQAGCGSDCFENELMILEELVAKCYSDGEVIIIGDVNCHFGGNIGPRGWGKTSPNGKKLINFMNRSNLKILDLNDMCKGPNYTYYVEGVGCSYIDHCIGSPLIASMLNDCIVAHDDILNTSDHLPITISINIDGPLVSFSKSASTRVAWHKLTETEIVIGYTSPLDLNLQERINKLPISYAESIRSGVACPDTSVLLEHILHAISETSLLLPQSGYKRHLKPYWSVELTELSKANKHAFSEWKKAGRPHEKENKLFCDYKKAKKEFRQNQRKHQYEYELRGMNELENTGFIDNKLFWSLVNKSRKITRKRVGLLRDINGDIVTDVDKIRNIWANHFITLFTAQTEQAPPNLHHIDMINSAVKTADSNADDSSLFACPFTYEELQIVIKKLKKNKATGDDGITAEHLKYGGILLNKCMLSLFNGFLQSEKIPNRLKKGLIIPIPKGKADPMVCNNNRGITLLSVLNKIYQLLLMFRDDPKITQMIEEVQGAGVKKVSCLHTSLLLKEVVANNCEKDRETYIAFLDTKKAFDTVWHGGLFYKMLNMKLDTKLWRILRDMYKSFQCAVVVGNQLSNWFDVAQGVHQGAPCSLWLYKLFVNDLLQELQNSKLGAKLYDLTISCVAYADDIAITACHHSRLQHMLEIAHRHSIRWCYEFNADKSEVVIFPNVRTDMTFWLGRQKLPIVKKAKHVGIINSPIDKEITKHVGDRISAGRRAFIATHGLGSQRVQTSTKLRSKLYWSISVPIITYGLEVTEITDEAINMLENSHWASAKEIQNLPQNTPNPAVLPQIGWFTLNGHIDFMRLMFLWRIFLMPSMNIYKIVAIHRIVDYFSNITRKGPIRMILETARKYDLLDVIKDSVFEGFYIPKSAWHKKVKNAIYDKEWTKHAVTFYLYKNIELFRKCINCCKMSPWWVHASRYPDQRYKITLLMKLLVGVQSLEKDDTYNMVRQCSSCTDFKKSTVTHMLFECPGLMPSRNIELEKLKEFCPISFINDFNALSREERCSVIFSGLGGTYIMEHDMMYSGLANFVYNLYQAKQLYNNITTL